MRNIYNNPCLGVFILVFCSAYIQCSADNNLDGYTYEFDEEPLTYNQDQKPADETAVYSFDSIQHNVLDVALVMDSSYTITSSGWYRIKKAAQQIIDGLDISPQGTHVSLMKFSTDVQTFRIFEEDADKEKLKKEIDGMAYDGEWSRLDLAVRAVDDHVFSSGTGARLGDVPKAIIIFTDGKADGPTQPDEEVDWQQRTLSAIQSLHKKNVVVYVVSVGTFADPIVLNALTSPEPPVMDPSLAADQAKSSGKVFDISDMGALLKSLDSMSVKVPKVTTVSHVTMTVTATTTPVTKVTAVVTTTVPITATPSSSIAPSSASSSASSSAPVSETSSAGQSSPSGSAAPPSVSPSATAEASSAASATAEASSAVSATAVASSAASATAEASSASVGASLSPSPSVEGSSSQTAASSSAAGGPSESASSSIAPSPSAAASSAAESAAASATPTSSETQPVTKVLETATQTETVTVTVQATQTVLTVQKGTPILIQANKKRQKRSAEPDKPGKPAKWYHKYMPQVFKRWFSITN